MQIKITKNTIIKDRPIASNDLLDIEKLDIKAGSTIEVVSITPASAQHLKLIYKDGSVKYVYEPHTEYTSDSKNVFHLDLSYYCQRDNDDNLFGPGYRQCNLTSVAMVLDYCLGKGELGRLAKANGFNEPESYYGSKLVKYGDTTDHDAHTRCLSRDFKIETTFSYAVSLQDLCKQIGVAKLPMVVGMKYKASGHMIVAKGYDLSKKQVIVNDPYGVRYGVADSYDTSRSGESDTYSFDAMDALFWDMGSKSGWGRIITSIKGVPTGM